MYDKIKLLALSISSGESIRTICPYCNGGSSKERSFSITRTNDGLLYRCFRARCSQTGFVPSINNGDVYEQKRSISETRDNNSSEFSLSSEDNQYELEGHVPRPLSASDLGHLSSYLHLSERECASLCIGTKGRSFCYGIYGQHGERKGYTDRVYSGRIPKAISNWREEYRISDKAKLHYDASAQMGKKERIVVVEDQVSAKKVGRYAPCVALLGAWLSDAAIEELMEITDTLIIALDPDAYIHSLKFKQKYSLAFKSFVVKRLKYDPKDMTDEELVKEFGDYGTQNT